MNDYPIRNASFTGSGILSLSGEFTNQITDVIIPGRLINFKMIREYRSNKSERIGLMGRGWFFNYERYFTALGKDLVYHDEEGREFIFKYSKGEFVTPVGLYCKLIQQNKTLVQKFRYGTDQIFKLPKDGGRLIEIKDRNSNCLKFIYGKDTITISDTFSRNILLNLKDNKIDSLKDFTGRTWKYVYDKYHQLIEVHRPPTGDFPRGTIIKYGYNAEHKLIELINGRGQTYIRNYFDQSGKTILQEHGSGLFKINYSQLKKGSLLFFVTETILKNGAKLTQEYSNNSRELISTREISIDGDKFEKYITKTKYNEYNEVVSIEYPEGNSEKWYYNKSAIDILAKGNLLKHEVISSKRTDKIISSCYEYEPKFQLLLGETNPRGNSTQYNYDSFGNIIEINYPKTEIQPIGDIKGNQRPKLITKTLIEHFEYNKAGQIVNHKHTDGTVDAYFYYSENDPFGRRDRTNLSNSQNLRSGLLAKIIKDSKALAIQTYFEYDVWGNQYKIKNAKGHTITQNYNSMGYVEELVGREPFKNKMKYNYDEDYNLIEESKVFQYNKYSKYTQKVELDVSLYKEQQSYNTLGNVIERRFIGDDKIITERFIRDSSENLVKIIDPVGLITEYKYDERNLIVGKRIGTDHHGWIKYCYSKNGKLKTLIDSGNNEFTNIYDGYQRYVGFKDPTDSFKSISLDENGNYIRIESLENPASRTKKIKKVKSLNNLLDQVTYLYDAMDRPYRIERKWFDLHTGKSIGKSNWDNKTGIINSVIEYGPNNLPVKIWDESNSVISISYDGLNRMSNIMNSDGEIIDLHYDENDNLIKYLKSNKSRNNKHLIICNYDELDRLVSMKENDEAAKIFKYNSINSPLCTIQKSGLEIKHLQDAFGRPCGQYFETGFFTNRKSVVQKYEYYDNYKIASLTDPTGQTKVFNYNEVGLLNKIILPDGNFEFYEYNSNSQLIKSVSPDQSSVVFEYDQTGRMISRNFITSDGQNSGKEIFDYDGLSRITSVKSNNTRENYKYDSLSRVIEENINNQSIEYNFNSAGSVEQIKYPEGYSVKYEYDTFGRCSVVKDKNNRIISHFLYDGGQRLERIYLNDDKIECTIKYNSQDRLHFLEWRPVNSSLKNLINGNLYAYDDVGRMLHEVNQIKKSTKGDCYYYNEAGQLIMIRYNADDVYNPYSKFEFESTWEYYPSGAWKRQVDYDSNGAVILEKNSILTPRNNYLKFGEEYFEYDENGRCIFKGNIYSKNLSGNLNKFNSLPLSGLTGWYYEYDTQGRLIKATQKDNKGDILMTILYEYDSQNRLIKRIVTSKNGRSEEYIYVWIGNQLAQEWKNGSLIKEYIYTIHGSLPARLRDHTSKQIKEIDILFNGRGYAEVFVDSVTLSILQRLKTNGFGHTELDTNSLPTGSGKPNVASIFSSILNNINGIGSIPTPIDILNQHQSGKTGRFNNKMKSIFGHSPASMQDSLTGNSLFGGGHGNSLINSVHAPRKNHYFPYGPNIGEYSDEVDDFGNSLKNYLDVVTVGSKDNRVQAGAQIAKIFVDGVNSARRIDWEYLWEQIFGKSETDQNKSNNPDTPSGGTPIPGEQPPTTSNPCGTPSGGTPDLKNPACPGDSYPRDDDGGSGSRITDPSEIQRIINARFWVNKTPVDPRFGNHMGGPVNVALLPSIDPYAFFDDMGRSAGTSGLPEWMKTGSHPLYRFGGPGFGGSIRGFKKPGVGVIDPK